jgi:hypothetical protein
VGLILRFAGHTDWSQDETELSIQKLTGYLDRNKIPYNREIGEYGSFNIEITRPDLMGFLSFLTEQLHAPRGCLHFPYQTLCVNGEGQFESIEYFPDGMNIEEFAEAVWNKRVTYPKVSAPSQKSNSAKALSAGPR